MQNKGLVSTFLVLLTIACLYSLSLTYFGSQVEKDAREYAQGDSKKEFEYLDSMSTQEVYPILGITYGELKSKMLNLGLDLKGGMNVSLEVQIESVIKALSSNSKDEKFNQAILKAKKLQQKNNEDFVTLFYNVYTEIAPNDKLVNIFYTLQNKNKISSNATNEEVINFIRSETEDAIDRSFNVLRTRIGLFGAAQPEIQRIAGTDRILVELPGIKDKERVRQLLQGTAKLEFWLTYENAELSEVLQKANQKLAQLINKTDSSKIEENEGKKEKTDAKDLLNKKSDTNEVIKESSKDSSNSSSSLLKAVKESKNKTSKSSSVDPSKDVSQDVFKKENPLFSVMSPNVYQKEEDNQYYPAPGPVVSYVRIQDTSKVNKYLSIKEIKSLFPPNLKFFWSSKPLKQDPRFIELIAVKSNNKSRSAVLDGDIIIDASQQFSPVSGSPEISISMNGEGTRKWKLITGNPDNQGKSIAIVLDNLVYSFPTVNSEIPNGQSQITGSFEIEEAQLIANILKAGKLPAPARIVEEAVVGPTLGRESISKGLISFIIALAIILLYIIIYYGIAGSYSVLALLVNMFFIFGVLASMPSLIALTLPGIAGIILTIGMSVDANVLIFERIREEISGGKSLRLAITDGYKNAYSSIVDANVTTLLTGFVLWYFGSGPVEGFAKTLVIGVFTSLITAIFITRIGLESRLKKKKAISFSRPFNEKIFKNLNLKFITHRKKFYIFSGIIILAGLGSLFTKGLQLGVDFKGGRSYVIRFDESVKTNEVASELIRVLKANPEVKTFGNDNQIKLTTSFMINSEDIKADGIVENAIIKGLKNKYDNFEILSSQKVGPTVADDIKISSVFAIVLSLIVIFLYIILRFKIWQFGLGALAALFHDVIITLSIFSIFYNLLPFSLEIDQAFIAAILTVVGYSINDTVVVFDRIREYLNSYKKLDGETLIDNALNSTLSRTLNTSLSTVFVLLMIFIFGGEVIRGFSFALLIGVIVGTYSSLCIATPIMYDTAKDNMKSKLQKSQK